MVELSRGTKIAIWTLIALSVLGVIAGSVAYSIQAKKRRKAGPRNVNSCPDYWVKTKNGNCKNQFNIGLCLLPQGEINFNEPRYQGENGKYEKCRWARTCEASWEGVDNLCANDIVEKGFEEILKPFEETEE